MAIILGTAIKTLMLDNEASTPVATDIKPYVKQVEIDKTWAEYNKTAVGDSSQTFAALKPESTLTLTCNLDHLLVGMLEGDNQVARTFDLEYAAQSSTATDGVKVSGEVVVTGVRPTISANGETELVVTLRPAGPLSVSDTIS